MEEVFRCAGLAAKEPSDDDRGDEICRNDSEVKRVGMEGLQEVKPYPVVESVKEKTGSDHFLALRLRIA